MSKVAPSQSSAVDLRATKNLAYDFPASIVVFLIALPLCLGIAFASGAPIIAGVITGIVGGLVVAPISKSPLSVSGPAAGLTVIVLDGIQGLGSYEVFLVAVVLAGVLQLAMGFLRAGVIAYYIPTSVVHGMLAGIGLTLILKQAPHAIGWDRDYEGDLSFFQPDGENTLTELAKALDAFHWGATAIAVVGLVILFSWPKIKSERVRRFPAPLLVVVLGVVANFVFDSFVPGLSVDDHLLVNIPSEIAITTPSFSMEVLQNAEIWTLAAVLAIVASIETLLCVEAIDKQDPFGRETPMSHELKAQGVGNIVAGLLGGIPLTAVIVRGSANVQSGGRTWASAFIHALFLLLTVFVLGGVMNMIPLASLAAVLIYVGYKLVSVDRIRETVALGYTQWLPFAATAIGIVFIDLLKGVLIGLAIGIFFVLRVHSQASYFLRDLEEETEDGHLRLRLELSENVSFLNKAALRRYLQQIPNGARVTIDARRCLHIDVDARVEIREFIETAHVRGITVEAQGLPGPGDGDPGDDLFAGVIDSKPGT